MECFLLSRDLMFTSQLSGAASSAGCTPRVVGSLEQIRCEEPHFVVLDLGLPDLNISTAVQAMRQNDATVIAVGPHVREEQLSAATEAGCDCVLNPRPGKP